MIIANTYINPNLIEMVSIKKDTVKISFSNGEEMFQISTVKDLLVVQSFGLNCDSIIKSFEPSVILEASKSCTHKELDDFNIYNWLSFRGVEFNPSLSDKDNFRVHKWANDYIKAYTAFCLARGYNIS